MPRTHYERLSPESAAFLSSESSHTFSHSAALLIFEPGPLGGPEHGVDFDAIRAGVEARLSAVPRARQKLRWIPIENHPVWVDDPDFNLEYHLRHTSLPRPGNETQLRRMVARIHAQRLDRNRPLWECWVLEGLEGGRFAMLWKTHHCMTDAASGRDLLGALLSDDPDETLPPLSGYRPRPMPSAYELMRDEIFRRASLPRQALAHASTLLRAVDDPGELEAQARGVAKLLGYSIRPRNATPLSGPSGPHRRFARVDLPLESARQVHRELDASLNDVLLAALAGAVRNFFLERLVNPATVDFRVSAPVTLDTAGENEDVGEWILDLPIWEKDPLARVARIREQTRELGRANSARAARALLGAAQWSGSRRLTLAARAVSRRLPVDLVLVNLPGPHARLYFRGAPLDAGYGIAPLRADHALGVTVTSTNGRLCWGLNADFDRLPDLERFEAALEHSFDELVHAARRQSNLKLVGEAS